MEKMRRMLPYWLVIIFAFYVLPLFIRDTGSAMSILLIGIPMFCFIVSFVYGIKNSFNCLFSLLVMLLFAPTVFIFYNESASIYILGYGIISIIDNAIRNLICKKNQ